MSIKININTEWVCNKRLTNVLDYPVGSRVIVVGVDNHREDGQVLFHTKGFSKLLDEISKVEFTKHFFMPLSNQDLTYQDY